jgi:serine/threonine protein kinase/predicted Zn-dependent peptidase
MAVPSEPDDAETVAGSEAPGDTIAIDPPSTLATSARRALDARRAPEPDPAQIGRFRIGARIGAGGMGVVYAAHDDELDRDVAIKLLRTNLAAEFSGQAGRERLMREAQAIARLSHPNIVHVYEVGNDGDRVFMAMELIRGETLRVYCKGRPWREIVEVFLGAGEGLAAAHAESIIHRDFKPDNVIVDERGRARVVDFGLARAPAPSGNAEPDAPATEDLGPAVPTPTTGRRPLSVDLTGAGTVLGTPAYMAPEQLAKADPDARTDQFAFCVSLFEMLYERRPFKGSTYTEIAHAVLTGLEVDTKSGPRRIPRAVRRVILRGLSRAAEARFATMSELLVALRRASAPTQLRVVGYALAAAAAGAVVVKLTSAPPTESASPPVDVAPQREAPADPWAKIVARTDLPDPVPRPLPGDPTGVSVHRLRNGLTLYVAPRPMAPKVSVTVAVRAGSEQERAWGPGLAFMVMNAIYRGTERIGVRDAALERPALLAQHRLLEALPAVEEPAAREAIILATTAAELMGAEQGLPFDLTDAASALGGDLSGSRTGSGTTYALEVPAVRIEGGLALIAEAVQHPVFRGVVGIVRDQLDLYTSLTSNDLAWQVVQRELAAATGLREDFESAGRYMRTLPFADANALHATYYRPNNTAVVMVGDVTPERAIALCEQYFGAWEPAAIPSRVPLDAPLTGGVVRREIEDGGAPAVFVSWPLPPTDSPDYPAFVALADALNRQDGLGSALRERTGGASWDLTAYRSLDLRATARPDQSLVEVEFEIDLALRAIAEDTLPDAAWEPALARAELARLRWARDPKNLTEQIAASFIDRRPWSAKVAELSATPSRAELVGAARLLRGRSRVVVHRRPGKTWVLPRFELPGVRPPERYGGQSSFARSILDAPVAPPEPQFLVAGSH